MAYDRVLRRLEAMLIVADKTESLIINGNGDVVNRRRSNFSGSDPEEIMHYLQHEH